MTLAESTTNTNQHYGKQKLLRLPEAMAIAAANDGFTALSVQSLLAVRMIPASVVQPREKYEQTPAVKNFYNCHLCCYLPTTATGFGLVIYELS